MIYCIFTAVKMFFFCTFLLKTKIVSTVKFLNFRMPENFAVIYLKFKEKGQNVCVFLRKEANGMVNSEDPDQTAPLGAV